MNDSYLEVLRQYEGEVTGVRRGRGAWICEYPDGLKLLKEYRGTVKRLEFEDAVLGALEQQGICRTDRYGRFTGDCRKFRGRRNGALALRSSRLFRRRWRATAGR